MSGHQNWATPRAFFAALDRQFHFTLDVCAEPWNAKCSRYITVENDGLGTLWGPQETVWCNPPYKDPTAWLTKGLSATQEHLITVVYLLPAATDTKWFHDFAMRGEVWFIKGRLAFEKPPEYVGDDPGPTFPSMLVVFTPEAVNGGKRVVRVIDRDGCEIGEPRAVQRQLFGR